MALCSRLYTYIYDSMEASVKWAILLSYYPAQQLGLMEFPVTEILTNLFLWCIILKHFPTTIMLELLDDMYVQFGVKQKAPSQRIAAFKSYLVLNCIEVKK